MYYKIQEKTKQVRECLQNRCNISHLKLCKFLYNTMNKGTSEQGNQNYIKNLMASFVKMLNINSNRVYRIFIEKEEKRSGIVLFGLKLSRAAPAGFSH